MNKTIKTVISVLLLIVSLGLAALCFMYLPDTVTMQIGTDGLAGSSMPKTLAVAIPLILSLLGSVLSFKTEAAYAGKSYVCAIAGIVVMAFELIFN